MPQPRVAIVGGGAAGLSAAIAAARLGASATVLESGPRVGRKILASGNGRCNLTNVAASADAYDHPEFVTPVLEAYPSEAVRSFFGGMGLLTSADEAGRVYPATNTAVSVLEVMRLECAELGVAERCEFEAVRIAGGRGRTPFEVSSGDGETVTCDAVVVSSGGGRSLLADLGHAEVECVPALVPLRTETEPIRGLSGVRVRCAASIVGGADGKDGPVATEAGELLFREYGVSGIMIFDLSRALERGGILSVDFFPDIAGAELEAELARRGTDLARRTAATFFGGMLHDRVARAVLRAAHVDAETPAGELPFGRLAALLKDFRLTITGRGDAKQAQVTRGGASVDDFDPATLESRRVGGVFAAGEVLDIDGPCGGFNLHWAWASGIVAGEHAARWAAARGDRQAPGGGGTR